MIKTRQIIIRVIILLMIIALIWLFIRSSKLTVHPNKPENPDAFMTNIHAMQIDKDGKLQNILDGTTATHYAKDNVTTFDNPRIVIHKEHQPPWYISADNGKALNGVTTIQLWGNVQIHQPPGVGSHDVTFLTTQLTYYPDQSFATTDEPVTIKRPGSIVHATGLRADLKKGYVKLMSKTDAQYGTKPFKSSAR